MNIILSEEILDTVWAFFESCALDCKRKAGKVWLTSLVQPSAVYLILVAASSDLGFSESHALSPISLIPFSFLCLLASVKHQSTKVLPQKSVRSLWNHTWGHAIAWRHTLPERVGLDCLLGFGNKMEIFVIQIFMYPKKGNRKKSFKKIPKRGKDFLSPAYLGQFLYNKIQL